LTAPAELIGGGADVLDDVLAQERMTCPRKFGLDH